MPQQIKKSLADTNPELIKEWDNKKNEPLTPQNLTPGSGKKVWWLCANGHSYEATVAHRVRGTACPYCSGQKVLAGFNDLLSLNPSVASQWDYEKNDALKDKSGRDISRPENVSPSSGQKVWWKCDKGHEWEAAIYSRVSGSGCPICSSRQVQAGINDFSTINPRMALYWNSKKNEGLLPTMVAPDSRVIVWWKCEKGHEWKNPVTYQNRKVSPCPFCANEAVLPGFNDLRTTNPNIAKEWNTNKNGSLKPENVLPGSSKKVWWKCEKGHEWQTSVSHRVRGNNCPYCSGRYAITGETDLLATNPKLVSEWDYEKNAPLVPERVKEGSNIKVWWKCEKGHEWKASINSRTYHHLGCPYCSNRKILVGFNDLATVNPSLAKEWNYERNVGVQPTDVACGSGKKVWWKCEKGHEWQAGIVERHNGNGCPMCSNAGTSMPEQGIAFYLSQHCEIQQRSKIANKEIDIYLPFFNIGIEYDGAYYHKNIERDIEKTQTLRGEGVTLIRVKESDSNYISEDGCICFCADDMGPNYTWALNELFKLLSEMTGNATFKSISVNVKRDRLKIRERYGMVRRDYSIETISPELAKQWNEEKNGQLKPSMFSFGSDEKVWWKCEKGHEWQASISNRIKGRGCPVCTNRIIISGENDLATLCPSIAEEWNYDRNGEMKPTQVALNARTYAWWTCPNCKGEYQSWVYNRVKGVGCPFCSSSPKKVLQGYNDLATKHPNLLKEWNYDRNTSIKPEEILAGSNKKVWWKCEKGHEWQASVSHRVRGRNCPYCAGRRVQPGSNDLKTSNPLLAKEWNFEKNVGITPDMVTPNSNKKVWWKCEKGHEWEAIICNRNKGSGCPYCRRKSTAIVKQ